MTNCRVLPLFLGVFLARHPLLVRAAGPNSSGFLSPSKDAAAALFAEGGALAVLLRRQVEALRAQAADRANTSKAASSQLADEWGSGNVSASQDGSLQFAEKVWVSGSVNISQAGPSNAGTVAALFTWGAPGTCLQPLRNAATGGPFPGLRVVHRSGRRLLGSWWTFHDPVVFAMAVTGMKHPVMDALFVSNFDDVDPDLLPAGSAPSVPEPDLVFWVEGHRISKYLASLAPHVDPYNQKLNTMGWFAWAVYRSNNPSQASLAAAAREQGWNLVARTRSEPLASGDSLLVNGDDYVNLFQEPESLSCALAFTGSQDLLDWFTNLDIETAAYCGIPNVHRGFRNQLKRLTQSSEWADRMTSALGACSEVNVVGHSLGGALAELFSACAQRAPAEGEEGHEDYRFLAWTFGSPALLPALS